MIDRLSLALLVLAVSLCGILVGTLRLSVGALRSARQRDRMSGRRERLSIRLLSQALRESRGRLPSPVPEPPRLRPRRR